jgi:dipeptidase
MCDTFVALGNSTKDGCVLFGKNSDRDANEAHEIVAIPGANHHAGENVKCTYIEIPQVDKTYSVLLSKPFWMWGAEMGSNEFGVTIGNEALFTREAPQKEPGLTGMDLLRLALERSKTAADAMNIISELLGRYGQGGNCGYAHPFYYQNSFLICDARDAWVMETVGREWAAEKVKDVRSISNVITIGKKWDRASQGLVAHAVEKGWCKKSEEFDYSKDYSDPLFTFFAEARQRQQCTTDILKKKQGFLTTTDCMAILRTHRRGPVEGYNPGRGLVGADICMHEGFGPIRINQTTGSMVSEITPDGATHWLTGTAASCTSIFKPVWIDSGIPEGVKTPEKLYDESVMFWQHEALHREILKDFPSRIHAVAGDQATIEKKFVEAAKDMKDNPVGKRAMFSRQCFEEAQEIEKVWMEKVKDMPIKDGNDVFYRAAWKKLDKEAGRLN